MDNFEVGDVVLITSRSKRGEETRAAIITTENDDGSYNFRDAYGYGYLPSGQGRFHPEKIGMKPFGKQSATKIGHEDPRPPFNYGSLYRNPGYDIMHDAPRRGDIG